MAKFIKKLSYIGIIAISSFVMTKSIYLLPWQKNHYQKKYENIIVFGDSLSDSRSTQLYYGNNNWVVAQGTDIVGAPITSIDLEDQRNTWLNYFINSGYILQKTLYNRYQESAYPYRDNVSYAFASAESGLGYIDDLHKSPWPQSQHCNNGAGIYSGYSCVPNLRQQVRDYLADVKGQINPNTLYIVWVGGNDLYQNIAKLITSSDLPLSHPILNITRAVNELIDHGVNPSQIMILNLPNFSMVPAIYSLVTENIQKPILQKMALQAISLFSQSYNALLQYTLIYASGYKITENQIFHIDQLFLDVYKNPQQQQIIGITHDVNTTCLSQNTSGDCKGYIFYNEMHPTTEVHQYLSQQLNEYIFCHDKK